MHHPAISATERNERSLEKNNSIITLDRAGGKADFDTNRVTAQRKVQPVKISTFLRRPFTGNVCASSIIRKMVLPIQN